MNVINPDEWDPTRAYVINHPGTFQYAPSLVTVLCLLDLARYGIRWGAPEPEWVRCVDTDLATGITYGKTYRVVARGRSTLMVVNDYGDDDTFLANRFVPASADEATVTIEVPVAWARARATLGQPERALSLAVDTTCREALTKAGLL